MFLQLGPAGGKQQNDAEIQTKWFMIYLASTFALGLQTITALGNYSDPVMIVRTTTMVEIGTSEEDPRITVEL